MGILCRKISASLEVVCLSLVRISKNAILISHNIWKLEGKIWILEVYTAMTRSDVLSGGTVVQDFIIEGSDTSTRSIRIELVLVT